MYWVGGSDWEGGRNCAEGLWLRFGWVLVVLVVVVEDQGEESGESKNPPLNTGCRVDTRHLRVFLLEYGAFDYLENKEQCLIFCYRISLLYFKIICRSCSM